MEDQTNNNNKGTVIVTGATGYLAGWIIKQLLESGWTVKGTVRDPSAEDKIIHLKQISEKNGDRLQFVKLDFLQDQADWEEAVKDCDYVIHTASPVPVEVPKDENLIVKPAIEGTLKVLKACAASPNVKRVVLTSSEAAIHAGWESDKKLLQTKIFTEEDWSKENKCPPYPKSKLLAERAAWEYIKSIPERNLEFVVINPSYILGPLLSKFGGDTSRTLITRLLKNEMPGLPASHFQCVDVRDVSNAHVIALTSPNAPGHRFICSAENGLWVKEMAAILKKEFTPKGYTIPSRDIPNAVVWMVSWWDEGAQNIYPRLGVKSQLSNEKIRREFGIEFRNLDETVIDMANSIIEFGLDK